MLVRCNVYSNYYVLCTNCNSTFYLSKYSIYNNGIKDELLKFEKSLNEMNNDIESRKEFYSSMKIYKKDIPSELKSKAQEYLKVKFNKLSGDCCSDCKDEINKITIYSSDISMYVQYRLGHKKSTNLFYSLNLNKEDSIDGKRIYDLSLKTLKKLESKDIPFIEDKIMYRFKIENNKITFYKRKPSRKKDIKDVFIEDNKNIKSILNIIKDKDFDNMDYNNFLLDKNLLYRTGLYEYIKEYHRNNFENIKEMIDSDVFWNECEGNIYKYLEKKNLNISDLGNLKMFYISCLKYLIFANLNKSAETLIKVGHKNYILALIEDDYNVKVLKDTYKEEFPFNKDIRKIFLESDNLFHYRNNKDIINFKRSLESINNLEPVSDRFMRFLINEFINNRFECNKLMNKLAELIRDFDYKLKFLYEYLLDCEVNQGISYSYTTECLYDYLNMLKLMEYPLDKYPKSLKKSHDVLARKFNFVKNEKLSKFYESSKDRLDRFEYIRDDLGFIIKKPDNLEEIVFEGSKLRHCVGSYAEKVAQGERNILFVRKLEESDMPYVTLEISNNMITQCRGYFNKRVTERKTVDFLKRYMKEKSLFSSEIK